MYFSLFHVSHIDNLHFLLRSFAEENCHATNSFVTRSELQANLTNKIICFCLAYFHIYGTWVLQKVTHDSFYRTQRMCLTGSVTQVCDRGFNFKLVRKFCSFNSSPFYINLSLPILCRTVIPREFIMNLP